MTLLALATLLLGAPSAETDFAARLHGELAKKPGNLFYSPVSVRLALAMAYAGAKGETATEMEKALGLPPNATQYFKGMLADWRDLANPPVQRTSSNDPELQRFYEEELARRTIVLRVGNRLWGAVGKTFDAGFLAALRDAYGAPLAQLDFKQSEAARKTINDWVAEATADKIKDLIPEGVIREETKLIITNAIYLKARWQKPFEAHATHPEAFKLGNGEKVQVPTMHQTGWYGLADTGEARVLEVPYGTGALVMDIILPKAGLAPVEKAFAAGGLRRWVEKLTSTNVLIALPKFTTKYDVSLVEPLAALGMTRAFKYGQADFSGMDGTHDLFISKIIHQAYVDVNEQGTEAAAATAVLMAAGAVPSKPQDFKVDRPFLFVIRDTQTREIMFVGRIADPR